MGHPTEREFRELVRDVVKTRYSGVNTRLAEEIEMTLSAFRRGLKKGTFNVENLLRLAKIIGSPPSAILAVAGKGDVASLIESLYGPAGVALSNVDRRFLGLPDGIKRRLIDLIEAAREESPPKERRTARG